MVVGFQRAAGATERIGAPLRGIRVLMVDDGCSTGRTIARPAFWAGTSQAMTQRRGVLNVTVFDAC